MNEVSKQQDERREKTQKSGRRRIGAYFFIFLFFAIMFVSRHEAVSTIDCTPEIIAGKPDIIMLGAWWCTYCYQAKKYFQQNNISYCEYDMENTATGRQLYQEHGAGSVPIMLIGDYQLNGFSKQQVEAALSLLNEKPDGIQ